MLAIVLQLGNASTDIVEGSMIAFVSLSGVGGGVGDRVGVGVGWLAFPDFVRAVPAADEFFDARDVDDAVVEVADEFGHFLD